MTIKTVLQSAKLSRYYADSYATAEKSTKLDGRLFATIAEQQAWFARRRESAAKALRGDMLALRTLYVQALRAEKVEKERAIIEAEIAAIDREMKK